MFGKLMVGAAALGILAVSSLPAQAGEVYNRVENQRDRIAQGVRSGQLTYGEFARVESRLQSIAAQRRADLRANDGTLTPAERRQLNRELNGNSRAIYFDKHNRADQPGV